MRVEIKLGYKDPGPSFLDLQDPLDGYTVGGGEAGTALLEVPDAFAREFALAKVDHLGPRQCGEIRRVLTEAGYHATTTGWVKAGTVMKDGKPFCKIHRVTWDEQQASWDDPCADCGRDRHEHRNQ